MVFDSYATGDHREAAVTVVNQTPADRRDLQVRVRVYDRKGALLGENTYWQSQRRDDVGNPRNDQAFELRQTSGPT